MRRLPLLLLLAVCSCAKESPKKEPRELSRPRPAPAPAKDEGPDLSIYRPAVAAYLADARALAQLVREGSGRTAYAKALDASEDLFSRIPAAPPGAKDVERALKALRKAANGCQAEFVRYDRAVAAELGMRRLDRQGENAQEVERMAQERKKTFERIHQVGETLRARIEQVEALLPPRP